jgi:ComF family protein
MFRELIERASAAVPSQCAVCRAWPSQPLCEGCVTRFAQPVPRCRTCALAVPAGLARCGDCIVSPPPLDACVAAVHYEYPWSGCIAQFKFSAQPGWASSLASLLRATPWAEPAVEDASLVLPIPLSAARLRQRGFNQALELARRIAPRKVEAGLLLRIRETPMQSALPRAARLANMEGVFAVDPLRAARLAGQRVVLVDDVMTSGATLRAAAKAVKAAGASHVTALVLARTAR